MPHCLAIIIIIRDISPHRKYSFSFLVVVGFEFRASYFLNRYFTA
jgi:hypothetical protein